MPSADRKGEMSGYVPLSVREGGWRKKTWWRISGWRDGLALRLAPWRRLDREMSDCVPYSALVLEDGTGDLCIEEDEQEAHDLCERAAWKIIGRLTRVS